jgi:hypothetical protein
MEARITMPDTMLERHYRDRVQSVRQMALHQARETFSRQDLGDLVALCTELSTSGRQLFEMEFKRVFKASKPTVAWLVERRRALVELSDNYLQLARSIRSAVLSNGKPASIAEENLVKNLDTAIASLTQARQDVLARWPVGSDDEIVAAQSSAARNEGLDVDEAFAQIAGVDAEAWRKRLEEHQRHGAV